MSSFKHIFDRDESLHLFIIARTLAFAPEPTILRFGSLETSPFLKTWRASDSGSNSLRAFLQLLIHLLSITLNSDWSPEKYDDLESCQ